MKTWPFKALLIDQKTFFWLQKALFLNITALFFSHLFYIFLFIRINNFVFYK